MVLSVLSVLVIFFDTTLKSPQQRTYQRHVGASYSQTCHLLGI